MQKNLKKSKYRKVEAFLIKNFMLFSESTHNKAEPQNSILISVVKKSQILFYNTTNSMKISL